MKKVRSGDPSELPEWAKLGRPVIHSTFGKGVIVDIRLHKGVRAIEIDFGGRRKLLSAEYGIPHLRPASTS